MKAWGNKNILKSEDVATVERWEANRFQGPSVQNPRPYVEPPPAIVEVPAPVSPPSSPAAPVKVPEIGEDELEAIRQAAHRAGYDTGLEIGRAAGHKEGFATGEVEGREEGRQKGLETGKEQARELAVDTVKQFESVIKNIELLTHDWEQLLAPAIADLALVAARQILRGTVTLEPERLTTLIRNALADLGEQNSSVRIWMHPEDATVVEELVPEELASGRWKIQHDVALDRGGCRIESASMELDLSMPARWKRLADALGSPVKWSEDADEHQ